MLSQTDIQHANISFYPPLDRRASKRKVFLMAKRGAILEGITVNKKKRERYPKINVPSILMITNRPEHGIADVESLPHLGHVEQMLSDLTREVLTSRIRENLERGLTLWPEYSGLKRIDL